MFMKPKDIVIATKTTNGIDRNSVGIITSISQQGVHVHFVGKDEKVTILSDFLSVINVDLDRKTITVESTREEYSNRICNRCYILNRLDDKMSARCKKCRKEISGKSMPKSEKDKMEQKRPPTHSVYECPICEKMMIVGIRKSIIVPDHDHHTGRGREWLCHSCNSALGRFNDDISILKKAIDYLNRFK